MNLKCTLTAALTLFTFLSNCSFLNGATALTSDFKSISDYQNIENIDFTLESIIILKANVFKDYLNKEIECAEHSKLNRLLLLLKHRCTALMILQDKNNVILNTENLKHRIPSIKYIIAIDPKNKDILTNTALFNNTMRIMYINEELVPFILDVIPENSIDGSPTSRRQPLLSLLYDDIYAHGKAHKKRSTIYSKRYNIDDYIRLLPLSISEPRLEK